MTIMSATPIHVPRLNANDDFVNVVQIAVLIGDKVAAGAVIAEVETDKTIIEITSPLDGFILSIRAEVGEVVPVGGVIVWIGETGLELVKEPTIELLSSSQTIGAPTLGALSMLSRYRINAAEVSSHGSRVTVSDVQRHINSLGLKSSGDSNLPHDFRTNYPLPASGWSKPLTPFQRGMANTVQWHRTVPVGAYLDVPFDHAAWRAYASNMAKSSGALIDPLLSLIAYRLVHAAREFPEINATLVEHANFYYDKVNVGFSVKTESGLAMVVVRDAQTFDEMGFIKALGRLQRNAFADRLTHEQVSGATLSFSSLASAGVSRHVPVLPPNTSLIVAHSASTSDGTSVLGATYDHRLLDGETVARVLNSIKSPNPYRNQ